MTKQLPADDPAVMLRDYKSPPNLMTRDATEIKLGEFRARLAHRGLSDAEVEAAVAATVVDGVKTFETLIHARKVKNAEDGFSLKATLRQFVLGKDQDGDDVTTLVVDRVEAAEAAPRDFTFRKPCDKAAPVKTTAGEDEALAALAKATKEHGWATPDGEDGPVLADLHVLPVGTVTVSVDEWRDAFRSLDHERGRKACWTAFDRAAGGLVKKNIVGEYSNRRWRLL